MNRLCTDAISDLLFTTEAGAGENLALEGVAAERVRFVGNTMIDTLLRHVAKARGLELPAGLVEGQYAVLTLHRPGEGGRLGGACDERVVGGDGSDRRARAGGVPAHPRTRVRLEEFGFGDRLGRFDCE